MDLRRTPFHEVHAASGARFTEFGGWEMPLRYGSIIEEHREFVDAIRTGRSAKAAEVVRGAAVEHRRRLRVQRITH